MALTFEQWKEVLNTINLGKDDIVEAVKKELNKQDHNTYKEWEDKNFNLDHLIKMLGTELSFKLLHIATVNGHKDLVIDLLAHGTKIDEEVECDKLTALYFANKYRFQNLVIALSQNGTKVDEKRIIDKCTAFIFATAYGNKDIAIALLAPGADIDEEGECDKHILLHFANKYNMCDS